jgi:hypothetical protein
MNDLPARKYIIKKAHFFHIFTVIINKLCFSVASSLSRTAINSPNAFRNSRLLM